MISAVGRNFSGRIAGMFLLLVLSLFSIVYSIGTGSVSLPFGDIVSVLIGGDAAASLSNTSIIIMDIRLPRVMTAFIAGAVLAVAGERRRSIQEGVIEAVLAGIIKTQTASPIQWERKILTDWAYTI